MLERNLVSLPFAIRSMTGLAAQFLGLRDRGLVKVGFKADLLVIDLKTLRDVTTYEKPHAYSTGMVAVLVNGKFAIKNRATTKVLAGEPIERPD